ncbi:hypothetical protein V6N13_109850 [Hibiscus sabdariffa]|uniref:Uncharacterized protein n=1 Tax=Hibiscus sabdariffa TaxID=183260 RepID=A0ABR2FQS0_9ROSI
MAEASGVCVSMIPIWDFNVHEVVQSSFRLAYHLSSCISDGSPKRSNQVVLWLRYSKWIQDTVYPPRMDQYDWTVGGPEKSNQSRNVVVLPNLINGLHHSSTLPCMSVFGFDSRNSIDKMILQSSSEILVTQEEPCMFPSKKEVGVKSEEASAKCAASTGGFHCSKRRKLRIKKT